VQVIKAIIFDCFGVLTTEGFRSFCTKFLAGEPGNVAKAQDAMDQLNIGLISVDDFTKTLSELSGESVAVVGEHLEKNTPNRDLFDYIRWTLKPQFKIGMLSNAGADWLAEMFESKDMDMFDDKVLSFSVRMTKPDPEIYKLAAERLGVEPSECVFVDDIHSYCEGARAVGMGAVWYQDFKSMKTDLKKLLNSAGADN
jgi:FMN phosphatase YigB (HAD superfamily)